MTEYDATEIAYKNGYEKGKFDAQLSRIKNPKVYISGKITGDDQYEMKFLEAENFYRNKECIVLNPTKLPKEMSNEDYMRLCFLMIDISDYVIFLPSYKRSQGSKLEFDYCKYINKPIKYYVDDANIWLSSWED